MQVIIFIYISDFIGENGVCEEDNDLIQTVFTCHGNLEDPEFPQRFSHLLDKLSTILSTGENSKIFFSALTMFI